MSVPEKTPQAILTSKLTLQLERTQAKLQLAEQKIMELELSLLNSRDFAIGAIAQAGEAVANLHKLSHVQSEFEDANFHIANHLDHIMRLETAMGELLQTTESNRVRSQQLDLVYASASWKIGRFVMIPIRILRKIFS